MQEEERLDGEQQAEAAAQAGDQEPQADIPHDHGATVSDEGEAETGPEAAGDEAGAEAEPAAVTLEQAQAEAQHWRDQAMRATADLQNVRHRAERDVEKAHKFALEKFAADLLPVVDSLEQALNAANAEDEKLKPMLEGIRLTHKLFLDTLARFNIEAVDPQGEPFNPQFHEAMSMVESADCEPNTVIQVFQKGYLLNGRLVRAAKVVVSRAAANQHIDEQA